jgi:putative transposase
MRVFPWFGIILKLTKEALVKQRFSESQILSVLKESESGVKVADLCRKHGICEGTFFRWKSKYGGMEISDIRKMKELEVENNRLKRIVAQYALENEAMREVLKKNP